MDEFNRRSSVPRGVRIAMILIGVGGVAAGIYQIVSGAPILGAAAIAIGVTAGTIAAVRLARGRG